MENQRIANALLLLGVFIVMIIGLLQTVDERLR